MTLKTVIELLRNEAECVKSADACDRDCGKCSLVKPTKDILEMYETAINVLEKLSCKNCIYLGHAFDIERLSPAQRDHIAEVSKKVDSDLISRQAAIEVLRNRWLKTRNYEGIGEDIAEECEIYLKTLPSAQPEIIRCRDCKHWITGYITDADDFIPPKCGKYQQMVGHSSDDYCNLAERWEE